MRRLRSGQTEQPGRWEVSSHRFRTGLMSLVVLGLIIAVSVWGVRRGSPPAAVPAELASETGEGHGEGDVPLSDPAIERRLPNVVIFLIDTLRSDRIGAYGHTSDTTPNLDALAADGVLFEQCYAPAPWTLPSVVSMLTGTWPCEHGVLVDGDRLDPTLDPLALLLRRAGYSTASFYANPFAGPMSGLDRGYDVCTRLPATGGEQVESWLDEHAEEPFFLYIHNVEPHNPYNAPAELIDLFGSVSDSVRQTIKRRLLSYQRLTRVDFAARRPLGTTDNTAKQEEAMRRIMELKEHINVLYDAAVRQADKRVGEVVEVLERRGLWDDMLFIVLSDHGEELADHGGWQHDQSVYEELVHVPLVVHFPSGRFHGARVNEVVSLVDLVPTVLDCIGLPDESLGGRARSWVPVVRGERPSRVSAFAVTSMRINRKKYFRPYKELRGDVNLVVRWKHWKGIWNHEPKTLELYDLSVDKFEHSNRSEEVPELANAMRAYAQPWFETCRMRGRESERRQHEGIDPEVLEQLRSLGYVE